MSEELAREELPAIRELGSAEAGQIHCLAIVGEIEGHTLLPTTAKTTKYEHVMPLLAAVEESPEIRIQKGHCRAAISWKSGPGSTAAQNWRNWQKRYLKSCRR